VEGDLGDSMGWFQNQEAVEVPVDFPGKTGMALPTLTRYTPKQLVSTEIHLTIKR